MLVAEPYERVSSFMPWIVLAGGLTAAGQVASLARLLGMDTKALIAPRVASTAIGVAASVAGAALWGIAGVVGAQVIYGLTFFTWMSIEARRATRAVATEQA